MSIFSKIISGEIPSYKIAENELFYAFLDIFPSVIGHTLVVPKTEVDRLFDLPAEYLSGILTFAQPIAKAIQQAYGYDRINIVTIGFEVPHAHIHLLPMNHMSEMNALAKKIKITPEELAEVQRKILQELNKQA
jgi:histidine triad (HIT) family protein